MGGEIESQIDIVFDVCGVLCSYYASVSMSREVSNRNLVDTAFFFVAFVYFRMVPFLSVVQELVDFSHGRCMCSAHHTEARFCGIISNLWMMFILAP